MTWTERGNQVGGKSDKGGMEMFKTQSSVHHHSSAAKYTQRGGKKRGWLVSNLQKKWLSIHDKEHWFASDIPCSDCHCRMLE